MYDMTFFLKWFVSLVLFLVLLKCILSSVNVDQSKLSLIDLGSCVGESEGSNCGVCLAELGNFITANLNRHNHVPNRYVYVCLNYKSRTLLIVYEHKAQ